MAELVPLLGAAFVGGALADAFDRRRMMQITELSFAAASLVLVGNALLAHPHVWVLFAMPVVLATLDGLQRPSLEALVPRLVERDELMAAGALSTLRMTLGQIAGPALAGVLLATAGLPAAAAGRASQPGPDRRGHPLREVAPGARGDLRRPHRGGGLRHADGPLPDIVLFGLAPGLGVAVLGLAVAGGGDMRAGGWRESNR